MDLTFFILLGFLFFFPFGSLLSWHKKISVALVLSLTGYSSYSELQFLTKPLETVLINYSINFCIGLVFALPFVIITQFFELLVESFELIRGVNLSSVLSPLTEQVEMPLVVLVNIVILTFFLFTPEYLLPILKIVLNSSSDFLAIWHRINIEKLIIEITSIFNLYPSFFVLISLTMLTSDIALQLFQKIFQNFQVQDLSFGLRTINFVLVATYIIPVAPSVISEILKKVTQNCLL